MLADAADSTDARLLRFESFATSNGPDVHVFLARDESGVAGAVATFTAA